MERGISLNKFISSTGICSRREADRWIENGRVKINQTLAQKGNRVLDGDKVYLDGQLLENASKDIYIAFNKPPGITCTTDRRDRDNIIDFIGHQARIFPIGRLDKASSGLILLTNDGDIVNKILRKEYDHQKEYIVTVDRAINSKFLNRMSSGIPVLGTKTEKCKIEMISKFVFRIILTQGLNQQIRRMCRYLNYKVVYLKRIRIMSIQLDELKVGQWRNLKKHEVASLLSETQK